MCNCERGVPGRVSVPDSKVCCGGVCAACCAALACALSVWLALPAACLPAQWSPGGAGGPRQQGRGAAPAALLYAYLVPPESETPAHKRPRDESCLCPGESPLARLPACPPAPGPPAGRHGRLASPPASPPPPPACPHPTASSISDQRRRVTDDGRMGGRLTIADLI